MFSYFEVSYPGLTYTARKAVAPTPGSGLMDPQGANALAIGEWLAFDGVNISRDVTAPIQLPTISTASRLDSQSSGRATVIIGPKGIVCTTDGFNDVLTYASGDDLVVATFWVDNDGTVRSGLVPSGTAAAVTPAAQGDVVAVGTQVVARVLRAPYTANGVGVSPSGNVIDIQLV